MGTGELSGKPDEMLGITCDGLASHPGGVAILLLTSYILHPIGYKKRKIIPGNKNVNYEISERSSFFPNSGRKY